MDTRKEIRVVYPVLLSVLSVLFILSNNIDRPLIDGWVDILLLCLATVFVSLVVYIILLVITKSRYRAGLFSLIVCIPVFYYIHLINILKYTTKILPSWSFISLVLVLVMFISLYLWKHNLVLVKVTSILNILSIFLFLPPLINIGLELSKSTITLTQEDNTVLEPSTRSIYYIVVDGYGNNKVLKDFYNYDNREFTNWLESRDFFVNYKALSNYETTHYSLASSLNMRYLKSTLQEKDTIKLVQDSYVSQLLKDIGYKYISFDSGWSPTFYNKVSDLNLYCSNFSGFTVSYIDSTLFSIPFGVLTQVSQRERVPNMFNRLSELVNIEGPKFVLFHVISPHPPYIFDREGNSISVGGGWENRPYYVDQLIYLNVLLKNSIEGILSLEEDSIIILQSDHGPASSFEGITEEEALNPSGKMLYERFGVLSAVYPSVTISTPVNTFRLVFNRYYGTNLDILPNRSYYSFEDVTEKLK